MKRLSLILTALTLIAATAGLAQQIPPPSIANPVSVSPAPNTGKNQATPALTRSGFIVIATGDADLAVLRADKSLAHRVPVRESGDFTQPIMASPVLNRAGDRVYVVLQFGRVSAFSISSAGMLEKLWTTTLPNLGSHEVRATPALSADESTLYIVSGKDYAEPLNNVPSSEGRVYGLKTSDSSAQTGWTDGILAETYLFAHLAPSPVVLPDGKIVVATCFKNPADPNSDGGRLRAFSPNGSLAWQTAAGQGVFESTPALGTDGRIIIPQKNGNKLRCYAASGTWLWDATMATSSKANPVVTSFGEIVIADFDGNIYCFTQDGANTWTILAAYWDLPFPNFKLLVCQSPVVDAGGNVIIVDHFGRVVSIAPSGVERWSPKVVTIATLGSGETFSITSPVMTPTGEVLIMRENGKLYTFQNEHGPDAGIWPGFQRGSTHSGNIGDNAVDRVNLSYTVSYFPGTSELRWNSYYGYYEWITNYSTVNAVNDRGHVAGYSTASSWSTTKAVEWFSGYTMVLQGPPYANDPDGSQAYGMNWRGDTVGRFGKGYYGAYGSGNAGILWERNGSGTLGQGYLLPWNTVITSGEAKALNSDKWVVGNGFNANGTKRAVLWPYAAPSSSGILPTTVNDLRTLEGVGAGFWSETIGISAGRVIAGNSVAYQGGTATTRPFRLDYNDHSIINENGAVDELPDPGAAVGTTLVRPSQWIRGINENGQIVGTVTVDTSGSSSFPTKGYIYRHSTSAALSYKVPATQLVYEDGRNNIYGVDEAVAINARGQVLFKGFRYYTATPGATQVVVERPYYLLYTPSKTGFYNVTRQVFPAGAQINGLTDDGKLYGYVYSGGLPIGFVAVPNN